MKRVSTLSRRQFLSQSTQTAAALGIGSLLGAQTAAAATRKIGANDRVHVGVIGAGARANANIAETLTADNVLCIGLCDVADFRMDEVGRTADAKMKEKGHQGVTIERYADYRKLLDNKDIDAVFITTPDHWHHPIFLAALEAGKHIYQEKPFSYTYQQGLEMVAAAKKHQELIVQIGTHRRSDKHYAKAKELLDSGKLGKIKMVQAYDTRNWFFGDDPFFRKQKPAGRLDWETFEQPCSEKHPFDLYRYFTWRWYWDYAGGLVTDVGVHVMDIAHYFLGDTPPRSAVCNGGNYTYEHWVTPDAVQAVWDYGTHVAHFTSQFTNGRMGDGLTLYGTHGTLEVRGHHIYVWEEGKLDKPIAEFPQEPGSHQHNWINCIRGSAKPNAPVQLGHTSLLPSHMANIAYRAGKKVTWDAAGQKVVA